MREKVGRNDPCPCGSGKKHKACCLATPEPASLTFSEAVRKRAIDALYKFSRREEFVTRNEQLFQLFFGPQFAELTADERCEVLDNDDCTGSFVFWLLFEAPFEGPHATAVSRFLARRGNSLPTPERRYLEAMRGSHLRLYEVEAVDFDKGLRLRDCWDGTAYDVRERLATHQLVTHSVVALRLRPDPDGVMVLDGPGLGGFTHADKDAILSKLRAECDAVQEAPAIVQHVVYEMLRRPSPQIVTGTGEPIVFCKVIFKVKDRKAAYAALDYMEELFIDDDAGSHVWVRGKAKIVHATIFLEGARLVAQTHSAKRARAVRRLLERRLGDLLTYERTDEQDLQSALEEHRSTQSERPEPERPAIPKEIEDRVIAEYEERHYRSWVDMKLPALGGKTPRQAARLRELRGVLVGLLKDFIAGSERERRAGRRAYDFSWMWAELGIDPHDPTSPASNA